jgi:glucan-binding YG repeat protein
MKNGVTPEGWVADDHGWRYRRADGRFYKSCEKTIDGVSYTFDDNGYANA